MSHGPSHNASDPTPQAASARPSSLQSVKGIAREMLYDGIRGAVRYAWIRRLGNATYNRLGTFAHERLQRRLAKLFRGRPVRGMRSGTWTIRVAGKRILLPLVPDRMWLDWDAALSTLGHETEVKRSYAALLLSAKRPTLFLDVGANYGTHSLIFLTHGVETITFEPNPSCHGYFEEICALNGVSPRLEKVALGALPGVAELCYPEGETWLGSIDQKTVTRMEHEENLVRTQVIVRTLDEYLGDAVGKHCFLKIDAEGHEVAILEGAARVLAEVRPWVLFESWPSDMENRRQLFRLFAEKNYRIARVPLLSPAEPEFIAREALITDDASDFMAIPS